MINWTSSEQVNELGYVLHIYRQPGESVLAALYLQLQKEGLLEIVWHRKVIALSELLETARRPNNAYYACFAQKIEDPDSAVQLAGMGWAWDAMELLPGKNRCEVGMVFFRQFQDRKLTKAFCEMCLDDGFQNCGMETALGFSPVPNQAACIFHRAMGFEISGILPGYTTWKGEIVACQVSCMTRELWNQAHPAKPKTEAEAA